MGFREGKQLLGQGRKEGWREVVIKGQMTPLGLVVCFRQSKGREDGRE